MIVSGWPCMVLIITYKERGADMLDIDRLNLVMNGENSHRQGGKTTAMIVKMLTQVDFVDKAMPFYVFCGTSRYAADVKHRTLGIAREMGFGIILSRRFLLRVSPEHERFEIDIIFVGAEGANGSELQHRLAGSPVDSHLSFYDTYFFDMEQRGYELRRFEKMFSHLPF